MHNISLMTTTTSPAERLLQRAADHESGCLEVLYGPFQGRLYLDKGRLIQAAFLDKRGVSAAYDLLSLSEGVCKWHKDLSPEHAAMDMDVSEILAGLEETRESESAADTQVEMLTDPAEILKAHEAARKGESDLMDRHILLFESLNRDEGTIAFKLESRSQACYLIGRDPSCTLVLDDSSVEPIHASLLVHDSDVEIWDMGTVEKTAINGVPVERALLDHGDVLRIGATEFRYTIRVRRGTALNAGAIPLVPPEEAAAPSTDPEPTRATSEPLRFDPAAARKKTPRGAAAKLLRSLFRKTMKINTQVRR